MKTNKFFLLFVSLCMGINVLAQDFQVSFSEPQKVKSSVSIATTGKIGDKLFLTKADSKRNQYSILKFDKTLGLEKELMFKQKKCKENNCIDKHYDYLRTLYFKKNILVFFQNYDRETDNRYLYCQRMNLEGEFIGELTQIDNIEAKKKSNSGSFYINASEDSTKFVVVKNLPFDKKEDEKFAVKVYDSSLKNISNAQISLPYKDKNAYVMNYHLSNKGDLYMLVNVSLEKKEKVKGEDDQFFSLLCLNLSTDNTLADYRVQLPRQNVTHITVEVDNKKNSLLCSGFYSDIKENKKATTTKDIDGFFYMNVDVNAKKTSTVVKKEFNDDLVNKLSGNKEGKKLKEGRGINENFHILNFVKKTDGSSLIVAEWRETQVVTHCSQNSCTTTYYYHRNNIFAIHLSAAGEVISYYDIPKIQISRNDGGAFSGFLLYQKGDRVFFIYNDVPKNMEADRANLRDMKSCSTQKVKKNVLVAVELLKDGKYSKQVLLENKSLKMSVKPEDYFKLDDGVYIAPIATASSKKLGFVRFELTK